jgi:hypothetical protein
MAYDSEQPRHDWTLDEVEALFDLPFPELMFRAATVHRASFDPSEVQLSQLLSIKTGGCAEDCGYCSQSAKFDTGLKASKLMEVEAVLADARAAKAAGASRFCMGAAWRNPKDKRPRQGLRDDRRRARAGHGNLRHAGHADRAAGDHASNRRGSTTTTTISTPRPSTTATSSAPAPIRTGWTRWNMCGMPASMCAAAASSAWARAPRTASV